MWNVKYTLTSPDTRDHTGHEATHLDHPTRRSAPAMKRLHIGPFLTNSPNQAS